MRIGFIADAHSDVVALTQVLTALQLQGVDQVVSLGDALECRLSTGHAGPPVALDDATSFAEEVAALLADAVVVRGNQEERILAGVDEDILSPGVGRLLEAPYMLGDSTATYAHGHQLRWMKVGPDHWQPAWPSVETRILVHGHHHRSSLTAIVGSNLRVERTPPSDEVVQLRPDDRFLVNVGPAQKGCLAWAVFDEERLTVMFHYQTVRLRKAGS